MKLTKRQQRAIRVWRLCHWDPSVIASVVHVPLKEVWKYIKKTEPKMPVEKLPAYALEYLKLLEFEESWASYHCNHTLAAPEAWTALRTQREKVQTLLEEHIAGLQELLPANTGMKQVKKAAAAYEKLLDGRPKSVKKG